MHAHEHPVPADAVLEPQRGTGAPGEGESWGGKLLRGWYFFYGKGGDGEGGKLGRDERGKLGRGERGKLGRGERGKLLKKGDKKGG